MSADAFYYVDGIPTKGKWIDLELVTDEDDIKKELADAGLIPVGEDGEPDYDGDLLVADAEGLAYPFLGRHGSFDLADCLECIDFVSRNRYVSEEAVTAYINWTGSWSADGFENCYQGEFKSEEDFAWSYAEDAMEIPKHLEDYIDYEKLANSLFSSDFYFTDGFVFRNN